MAYKVQYMLLADGVQEVGRGKINIHGLFDKIFLTEIPGRQRGFAVVALLIAETEDELGTHQVTVSLERPGGRQSGEMGVQISLAPTGGTWPLAEARLVIGMANVPFREEGRHRIVLCVDGVEIADHPIVVELVTGDQAE